MTFVQRLAAVIQPIESDWGDYYDLISPTTLRAIESLALVTRIRPRFYSTALRAVNELGESFTLEHALRRMYRDLQKSLLPVCSPLFSAMKKGCNKNPVRWGGQNMYFDVVTT